MQLDSAEMKAQMEKKKISIRGLSRMTGISASTICRYVGGHINPTLKPLSVIADALGVNVTEILTDEKE